MSGSIEELSLGNVGCCCYLAFAVASAADVLAAAVSELAATL